MSGNEKPQVASLIDQYLKGLPPEQVHKVLEGLVTQAREQAEEEAQQKAQAITDTAAEGIESLEEQLEALRKTPGYLSDPKYKLLVVAHGRAVDEQVRKAQEIEQAQQQAQQARTEERRAALLSELRLLQQGYTTSPATVARQQELRRELEQLPVIRQKPSGRIDITTLLDRGGRR